MNKLFKIAYTILVFCILNQSFYAQNSYKESIMDFQKELNSLYLDTETSPLEPKDLDSFSGLEFFPVNEKFRVHARFNKVFNPITVTLKTTSKRAPEYKMYGFAEFTIDGNTYKLNVYQNVKLAENEQYHDYLFLPFTDRSNGKTSYYGGRYIDFENTR